MALAHGYTKVNQYRNLSPDGETPRDVAEVVNNIMDGKTNNTGEFTAGVSASTTVVADLRVGDDSVITLMPTASASAAEVASTYVSAQTANQGFTVTHPNNATPNRTYRYVITG